MTAHPGPKRVRAPKTWCDPPEAFGKLGPAQRVWQRPSGNDQVKVAQFRAAVVQNAIAVHVREFKNLKNMPRTGLVELDPRLDAQELWDARLNGRERLTMPDIATLMTVLPRAMPSPQFISNFLRVANGGPPRKGWVYPDT